MLDVVRRAFGALAAESVRRARPWAPARWSVDGPGTTAWCAGRGPDPASRRGLGAFPPVCVLAQREELARQTAAARELEAANRTRTALLAAVSHDLRTPLAGPLGRSGPCDATRTAGRVRPRRAARRRRASAARLTRMVTDLLDMSRLQSGAVGPRCGRSARRGPRHRVLGGHGAAPRPGPPDLPTVRLTPVCC